MTLDITGAQMLWLNITNIALGAVVLICLVVLAVSVGRAILERRRKRATIIDRADSEVHALLHSDAHALEVPGLGFTMADGGEPVKPKATSNGR